MSRDQSSTWRCCRRVTSVGPPHPWYDCFVCGFGASGKWYGVSLRGFGSESSSAKEPAHELPKEEGRLTQSGIPKEAHPKLAK